MERFYVHQESTQGVKRTIQPLWVYTRKSAQGYTYRFAFGRWRTNFGGWTSQPDWNSLKI